jgi:hypothetical protein
LTFYATVVETSLFDESTRQSQDSNSNLFRDEDSNMSGGGAFERDNTRSTHSQGSHDDDPGLRLGELLAINLAAINNLRMISWFKI